MVELNPAQLPAKAAVDRNTGGNDMLALRFGTSYDLPGPLTLHFFDREILLRLFANISPPSS